MAKPRSQLRVLLIQVRGHRAAAEQEQDCFVRKCRLERHQLRVHDAVAEPRLPRRLADGADAVMIGGAGTRSATRDYPFSAPLADLVRRLLDEERPLFGSCWGHQFMARVLGGSVITDRRRRELGTYEIHFTAAGRRDPLLAGLASPLRVQVGHNDRIDREPPGIEVLASSDDCRHQLIRVAGKPAYGSQFHCEMNDEDIRHRLAFYREHYVDSDGDLERFERRLRPSPEADVLLDRFLEVYT